MAIGAYGISIPVNINDGDIDSMVDISYCYHENRTYDSLASTQFQQLGNGILRRSRRNMDGGDETYQDDVVEGMYTLQLPLSQFNRKGFYSVYIKPKEIPVTIVDVGVLTAYPNVRGIVIDTETILNQVTKRKAQTNNDLSGYRIIFLDDNGGRQDYYRIVTSNNKCEPVVQAPNSSSDKSYTYRYEDASTLTFLTVSPSSAPTFKSNATPYIGKATQNILLANTLFEPIMLDIEMTTHDADTISYMLEGSQLRDLDNGLVTTFNENNEIYVQHEHATYKDQTTGAPVYEVRENRTDSIDYSQTLDNINQ